MSDFISLTKDFTLAARLQSFLSNKSARRPGVPITTTEL